MLRVVGQQCCVRLREAEGLWGAKDTGTLQLKRTLWMFFDAAYGELLGNKASSWVSGSYIFPPLVKASRYHGSGERCTTSFLIKSVRILSIFFVIIPTRLLCQI